jgi:hypothetical protein
MGRAVRNPSTNVLIEKLHKIDAVSANSTEILVRHTRCTIGARNRARHSHSRSNEVL